MKRSPLATDDDTSAEVVEARLALLSKVATKAMVMGKWLEAKRLLASVTADFVRLVEKATTNDDWEAIARMHATLSRVLPKLEAATGRPWTDCLDLVTVRPFWTKPRRGQA